LWKIYNPQIKQTFAKLKKCNNCRNLNKIRKSQKIGKKIFVFCFDKNCRKISKNNNTNTNFEKKSPKKDKATIMKKSLIKFIKNNLKKNINFDCLVFLFWNSWKLLTFPELGLYAGFIIYIFIFCHVFDNDGSEIILELFRVSFKIFLFIFLWKIHKILEDHPLRG